MRSLNFALMISLFALYLCGCQKSQKDVLSEDKMVKVLTDIELADAYFNTTVPGPGRPKREDLIAAVLEKHGVSESQLDSTVVYYGKNMDEYYSLYEKVEKNLRLKSGNIVEDTGEDIWPYSSFAFFGDNQWTDGIIFSFPAKDLMPGNSLEWKLRMTSPESFEVVLGGEYENGMVTYNKKNSTGRNVQISLQTDTAYKIKRIFGSLNIPRSSYPIWADSIQLNKTEFDSLTYSKINTQRKQYRPVPKPKEETNDSTE